MVVALLSFDQFMCPDNEHYPVNAYKAGFHECVQKMNRFLLLPIACGYLGFICATFLIYRQGNLHDISRLATV
jgi:hypothetical protein